MIDVAAGACRLRAVTRRILGSRARPNRRTIVVPSRNVSEILMPRDTAPADPLAHAARATPSATLDDTQGYQPDMRRMRHYRLERVRQRLRAADVAGIVLYDPINIRYATGSRNMTVWTLHNAARYCFILTDGPIVLFEYKNADHLNAGLEAIDEIRPTIPWYFFGGGQKYRENAALWAAEIADLVRAHGGGNTRLLADVINPIGVVELAAQGVTVDEGMPLMELAREIKSPDEIACMNHAIAVCEAGMAAMHEAIRPGVTENQIWSKLHEVNIARGGEWIETRLLSSGDRTCPWFQESSDRVVRAGELVSYDTDLVGPFGMCADLSRSVFCGPGRPSDRQRRLFRLAVEQIETNLANMAPGMTFRELSEAAWTVPASCMELRYGSLYHGVGMCDEYPRIVHFDQFDGYGTDGVLEPGMCLCVESYIGEIGGREGVKIEEQVVITETGVVRLSTFPFDDTLLSREV
jgi:Xaa-Pro aminopeptidase